jgi:diguanylate cyclase (GGDEF)-like protein/PAS domain S-box-containing protein
MLRLRMNEKKESSSDILEGLEDSGKRYKTLLDRLPVGVYRTTPTGKVIEANPALVRILGYDDFSELHNINVQGLFVKKEDRLSMMKNLKEKRVWFSEFQLRRKDGKIIWCRDYSRVKKNEDGSIAYFDGILADITVQKTTEEKLRNALHELDVSNKEREKMITELKSLSLKDDLTGLYNRRGFYTIVSEYLKMAKRESYPVFLLFIDLDGLKVINDNWGHHQGDKALKDLTHVISTTFRLSDVKARIGGDEFALYHVGKSDSDVKKALERFQKNLQDFNRENQAPYKISVSYGISRWDPDKPTSLDTLLKEADEKMYIHKRRKQSRSK